MDVVETFDVDTLTVEIHYDSNGSDFSDHFENVEDSAVIVCSFFHTRSTLKDHNPFSTPEEALTFAKEKGYKVFSLWRYEHGQVMFKAGELDQSQGYPFNCPFDAGIEGFVLVSDKVSEWTEQTQLEVANSMMEDLTDWCNGSMYGFIIKDDEGDDLDSCWGFLGLDNVKEPATESANALLAELPKQLELEGLAV